VTTNGETEVILARPDAADEYPASMDVIDSCQAVLLERRAGLRVCAIVANVATSDGDAVQVDLEHVEGHALRILLSYGAGQAPGGIEYGPMSATLGPRRVWR
jgi:hypothetical protein